MTTNNRTVAIHQPNYLPWLGYFYKMINCDIFVYLDAVQYPRGQSFAARNRIKNPNGASYLTIPTQVPHGRKGKVRAPRDPAASAGDADHRRGGRADAHGLPNQPRIELPAHRQRQHQPLQHFSIRKTGLRHCEKKNAGETQSDAGHSLEVKMVYP